jgi:phenylalanyl-tRNA synthetase beta chain
MTVRPSAERLDRRARAGETTVRFSLNWIREFTDVTEDPDVLARRLTMAGLPVDRVERPASIPDTVVVARIVERRQHPNADRLSLCKVDAGTGEWLDVVCGAPNARDGLYVALATIGAVLPNGMTIKKSKIRGETSMGMLCSQIELGLGDDASGIIELEPGPVGTPLAQVLGAGDVILDIDIPANRGDCLSHLGLAREIAAVTGQPLRMPESTVREGGAPACEFNVAVESLEDCGRFTAHLIRDVTVGPSPAWLVKRLESVGQRSINNVVDVTNFVMQEMGQPLHSFDGERLGTGRILVRRARAGERLITLDDVDRALDPEVLLITDGERPIAAGGVMGGANTQVHEGTTSIVLEAAWFRPERVLKGSRTLRLDTDAAIRFRRGVDPGNVARAARRAAGLIAELAGGTVAPGFAEITDPALTTPRVIALRPAKVGETLGEEIPADEVARRLTAFGFGVAREKDGSMRVTVPLWRRDIFEECDLVEEVARHRGYDAIGSRAYNASAVSAPIQAEEVRRRRAGEILRGFGFNEACTRTLTPRDAATLVGVSPERAEAAFFPLFEPRSREEEGLRVSLLPSLLAAVGHNLRHGQTEVRLYELGKTFCRRERGAEELPEETEWIGLAAAGGTFASSLERAQRSLGLQDFKGFVEALLAASGIDGAQWRPYPDVDVVPPGAIGLFRGDRSVGFVWETDADTRARFDLNRPVYVGQVRLDALPLDTGVPRRYEEPSRFPSVRRDLALVVPAERTQDEVRGWVRELAGAHLAAVELFDHYRGKHIPSGFVGLGFSLTFRAPDRTLEDKDVDGALDRIVNGLGQRGITRRDV